MEFHLAGGAITIDVVIPGDMRRRGRPEKESPASRWWKGLRRSGRGLVR